MTNRRAKLAAGATVLGLGALGGVALGSNPGVPAVSREAAAGTGATAVVTSASGAGAVPVSQSTAGVPYSTRPPIVTRASGAGGLAGGEFDD